MAMPANRKNVAANAPASSRILPKFQTRVRSGSTKPQLYTEVHDAASRLSTAP